MTEIIIKNMKNLSDNKQFRFSLSCTVCGKTWYSTPIQFSKADKMPRTNAKSIVYYAVYEKEMQQAVLKAVAEAKKYFNLCPVCKSLVCDHCFMTCDDIDMCVDCARELGETGEVVACDSIAY